MCRKSYQATHLLFKYYVSKLGVGLGVKACADNADVILPNTYSFELENM